MFGGGGGGGVTVIHFVIRSWSIAIKSSDPQ